MSKRNLTRRAFVARAAAGSLLGALPALAVVREAAPLTTASVPDAIRDATPVISFHLDYPYVDPSGQSVPYVPPAGARGAQAVATLSEAAFFCCTQRY